MKVRDFLIYHYRPIGFDAKGRGWQEIKRYLKKVKPGSSTASASQTPALVGKTPNWFSKHLPKLYRRGARF